MKRILKSARGVTLLEVMLVLAIAAMIIVMSIRYYQSATASQEANTVVEEISSIISAADGLSQATGSYSALTSAMVAPLLPANGLVTPWGTAITPTFGNKTYYKVVISKVPANICGLLIAKLQGNTHFSSASTPATLDPTTCTAGASSDVTVYYISNP